MRVGDVMARDPATVRPDTALDEAARLVAEHGLGLLPVLGPGGTLVGVLEETVLPQGSAAPDRRCVDDVMTRTVHAVTLWCDLAVAVALLLDSGRASLPVLSEGALVGTVSRCDVARALGHSDADLVAAVSRRLDTYAGWHRWDVHAHHGRVVLCDDLDEPLQQHIATVIAAGVPGTRNVATHRRDVCPEHGVAA